MIFQAGTEDFLSVCLCSVVCGFSKTLVTVAARSNFIYVCGVVSAFQGPIGTVVHRTTRSSGLQRTTGTQRVCFLDFPAPVLFKWPSWHCTSGHVAKGTPLMATPCWPALRLFAGLLEEAREKCEV